MSTNLHCRQMELWQTPSYITDMCMYRHVRVKKDAVNTDYNGAVPYKAIKDTWLSIREKYILWCEQHTQDMYNHANDPAYYETIPTEEGIREYQDSLLWVLKQHKIELRAFKRLDFYAL